MNKLGYYQGYMDKEAGMGAKSLEVARQIGSGVEKALSPLEKLYRLIEYGTLKGIKNHTNSQGKARKILTNLTGTGNQANVKPWIKTT